MTYRRGVVYLLLAGVFLSTTGVFVRSIESASPWQVLFYRSIAFSCTVLALIAVRERSRIVSRFCNFGRADIVVAVGLGAGFIFYLLSVFHTTIANTVLLLSSGPLFAALLGWLVLRERISVVTWIAMLLAGTGVVIMFGGDVSGDHLTGMMYALAAVLSFSVLVVALRSGDQSQDRLPATALAGLVAAGWSALQLSSLTIGGWDLLMSLCLGTVQVGFGFILITLGSRGVPAAQVPLLVLTETALAPIWVWWWFDEVPAALTLLGGALVIGAVLMQGVMGVVTSPATARDAHH